MAIRPIKNETRLQDPAPIKREFSFSAGYEVLFNLSITDEYTTIINLKVLDYLKTYINNITWVQVHGPDVVFSVDGNIDYSIDFINEDPNLTKIFKVTFLLKNNSIYELSIPVFKKVTLAEGYQWDDSSYVLFDDNSFIALET